MKISTYQKRGGKWHVTIMDRDYEFNTYSEMLTSVKQIINEPIPYRLGEVTK